MRYFCVSNSWKPSSPKLKTMSTICWPRSNIDEHVGADGLLQLHDARVRLRDRRRERRRRRLGALARRRAAPAARPSARPMKPGQPDYATSSVSTSRPPRRDSTTVPRFAEFHAELDLRTLNPLTFGHARPLRHRHSHSWPSCSHCTGTTAAQGDPVGPRARAAQAGAAHRRPQRLSLGAARARSGPRLRQGRHHRQRAEAA